MEPDDPTTPGMAEVLVQIGEILGPVLDFVVGERQRYLDAGFSGGAAEAMAMATHSYVMGAIGAKK